MMLHKNIKKTISIAAILVTVLGTYCYTHSIPNIDPISINKCITAGNNTLTTNDLLYFDTQNFLNNSDKVVETLTKIEDFKECVFKTPDNYIIHGLYKKQPNALCTIICCAGFYPGKKEGVASIVKIAENCNIVLFDARGHGKSGGELFFSTLMGQYVRYEYQDVIGAIQFSTQCFNDTPIYIWGICAGAVNAAHAIIKLTEQNTLHQYPLCGMAFDSGWASLTKISKTVPCAVAYKKTIDVFKGLYKTNDKKKIKQGMLFNCMATAADLCIKGLHTTLVQWPFQWYESETNLFDKIHTIQTPTLFIHSYDDTYAPIEDVKQLAAGVKNSSYWWIESPSKHASHHLKHTDEYIRNLNAHIRETVAEYKKNNR